MKNPHIVNITAVTEVYPDGQKCDGVIMEYDCAVSNQKLSAEAFLVENRNIIKVYANTAAEKVADGQDGCFVILELSIEDPKAKTYYLKGHGRDAEVVLKQACIRVMQKQEIQAVDGNIIAPLKELEMNNLVKNLVVDEFDVGEFESLKYNLFIPDNYDRNKSYPLVLFIHDAGCCGENPGITLAQGIGGVIWAKKEEQQKHECFVLAPQFMPPPIVNDEFEASRDLEVMKKLLDRVIDAYSIDKERIYTTGQSMGCMSSCELNVRYPDLFAASLLVAGQWNPQTMATIPNHHFWILVSEGDKKAFPGMNAITKAMKEAGARVTHKQWNAHAGQDELTEEVKKMVDTGANILYSSFELETIAKGKQSGPGEHHVTTWQVAYNIEAIRDWLFTNRK